MSNVNKFKLSFPGLSAVVASGYITGVAAVGGVGEPEDHVRNS
jgi:hypothetical protein